MSNDSKDCKLHWEVSDSDSPDFRLYQERTGELRGHSCGAIFKVLIAIVERADSNKPWTVRAYEGKNPSWSYFGISSLDDAFDRAEDHAKMLGTTEITEITDDMDYISIVEARNAKLKSRGLMPKSGIRNRHWLNR